MDDDRTDDLLDQHREALNTYREWDERIKRLLKGRRMRDLDPDDMKQYREIASKRDAAYNMMRHYERMLLDDIPGASTEADYPIDPDNFIDE